MAVRGDGSAADEICQVWRPDGSGQGGAATGSGKPGLRVRVLPPANLEEVRQEMRRMGVDPGGVVIMAPKGLFRLVLVPLLDPRAANIVKQEILARGGDAAVAATVGEFSLQPTDMLLFATLHQYASLIRKLYVQNCFQLPELGEAMGDALARSAPGWRPPARPGKRAVNPAQAVGRVLRAGGCALPLGEGPLLLGDLPPAATFLWLPVTKAAAGDLAGVAGAAGPCLILHLPPEIVPDPTGAWLDLFEASVEAAGAASVSPSSLVLAIPGASGHQVLAHQKSLAALGLPLLADLDALGGEGEEHLALVPLLIAAGVAILKAARPAELAPLVGAVDRLLRSGVSTRDGS